MVCWLGAFSLVIGNIPANVDWALLNFMQDWFPVESKQKLRQNEKEVAEEEWEELGVEVGNCVVM